MDMISDSLTRIRNGLMARRESVELLYSKEILSILEVLKQEGYIVDFASKELRKGVSRIDVELKYHEDTPVIKKIKRISKPSLRVYVPVQEIPVVFNGLGISILSTSKGVMSDLDARKNNIGGEVICTVF